LTAARSGKRSIHELAGIDPASFMKGEKTVFPGIGAGIRDNRHPHRIDLDIEKQLDLGIGETDGCSQIRPTV
jgi:hypothetical protein